MKRGWWSVANRFNLNVVSKVTILSQKKKVSDKESGDIVEVKGQLRETIATPLVSLLPEKYSPIEHACWKLGQLALYLHFAWTFDLVESEKGKTKVTSMLCNMIRSLLALSPNDVIHIVYLCTNKIAIDHKNIENLLHCLVVGILDSKS